MENRGATNRTSSHAGVSHPSPSIFLEFNHCLGIQLSEMFIGSGTEISSHKTTPFIVEIDNPRGSIGMEKWDAGMFCDDLRRLFDAFSKLFFPKRLSELCTRVVDDNGLQSLRPQYGSQASPGRMAARVAIQIGECDAGRGHFHLSTRTDGRNAHVLPVCLAKMVCKGVVTHPFVF